MKISRKEIIKEMQRVAKKKGTKKLTRNEFSSETGISSWQIYQAFDGWQEACELAGLEIDHRHIPLGDDDLFEEMLRVFTNCGEICTRTKFDKLSKYSVDTYKKHFGKWKKTLYSFRKWIEANNVDFPFLDQLPHDLSIKSISPNETHVKMSNSEVKHWASKGGTTYGPFLNFRGLQHAPINEQGVVFLFGMVCFELGFVVEAIRTDYPDCEAKRRVDKKRDKWERVKIEFEYKSSNFKEHAHDPKMCDLIICWEHNWSDCPLEVIELKTAIQSILE